MKIIDRIKERRKRKLEKRFYKAFPERESYVEPEKQMATMTIERVYVRPVDVCAGETLDISIFPEFSEIPEDLKESIKEYITRKIVKSLIENKLITFTEKKDIYMRKIFITGGIRVVPPRSDNSNTPIFINGEEF